VPGPEREAWLAVLNGVLGDHLEATQNPLAIRTCFRHAGHPIALEPEVLRALFPAATKILILVHGSCANDLAWNRNGHDHGAALAAALGCAPIYLHYNSGLHVSENGRALDVLLERLVAAWPREVEEITMLAHSMGGLVARSAAHFGEAPQDARWRSKLRKLITLGTPHQGAPLERGGHWIDVLLEVNRYSAPLARLGKLRSSGVTDLRFGYVRDEDWTGRDRFGTHGDTRVAVAWPIGVACFTIAATTSPAGSERLQSDGLVPVDSALGRHPDPKLKLELPETHQWIGHGMGHLDLLERPEVYAQLRSWLVGAR
jgi:pimeloyl-ACP methyl ester carboxylesterase